LAWRRGAHLGVRWNMSAELDPLTFVKAKAGALVQTG
jgi:hypothetical protein